MKRTLIACLLGSWVVLGAGNPSAWAKEQNPSVWDYDSFLDPNHLPLEEDLSEGEF